MGFRFTPSCCCGGGAPGTDCTGRCNAGTTPLQMLLTVPSGIFTWSGSSCPGVGGTPNCASYLEGSFLLEQTAICEWDYAAFLGGACDEFPIATCFGSAATYHWASTLTLRFGTNLILGAVCQLRLLPACTTVEQGFWELDLGPVPQNCLAVLSTPQTLTLVRRNTSRCVPTLGSTVQLVAA